MAMTDVNPVRGKYTLSGMFQTPKYMETAIRSMALTAAITIERVPGMQEFGDVSVTFSIGLAKATRINIDMEKMI